MVLESVLVFILLQVVDQFSQIVKDKVSIGEWIYLWAFYFVPMIYISVFGPAQYCLDDCSFVVSSVVRQVDSSSSSLLSQDCFGYLDSFPDLEPVCCFMPSSYYCFLTCIQVSQKTGKVGWYSQLSKNFPQFV